MKKILSVLLAAVMVLSMAACSGSSDPTTEAATTEAVTTAGEETTMEDTSAEATTIEETTMEETTMAETTAKAANAGASDTVTITSKDANGEEIELEVPYDPQRIAVMDLAALDVLDNIGMGDRVVGVSKGSSIDYLQSYVTDDNIVNLGTIKEADLEAVMACEPDVIYIGGRLSAQYDALSEIAPVVYLSVDSEIGLVESTRKNATAIGSMFGVDDKVTELMDGYDARIEALAEVAEGKTALVGMVTSGSYNVLGNDGRCSIIGVEIGFENVGVDADIDTSTHGNEASFEFIVQADPDYIFVMDRDAAIGTEGAALAQEVMENELVMQTSAYTNGNIVYLENPAVWYTAEGGITALDTMLSDLESALLK